MSTSKKKPVAITDPSHRPDDTSYFTFRTNINYPLVDTQAPDSIHLFEFSLRLLYTFPSSSASLSVGNYVPRNTSPAPVDTVYFTLSKMSDDDFQFISAA